MDLVFGVLLNLAVKDKMNKKICAIPAALLLSLTFLLPASAQNAADNTKNNRGKDSVTAPTADQAKNNLTDRDLMRRIRHDVVNDKSLSSYAHNVKIIAQGGRVTLRGPVHSEQEKQTIEDYAHKYVGNGSILNEITVKDEAK
jgi:osmotically-inducible protein OsmY